MTASSSEPAKGRWAVPSARATTLPHRCHEDPLADTVPASYHPISIAGIPCYRQSEYPCTPAAALKQCTLQARNTKRRGPM